MGISLLFSLTFHAILFLKLSVMDSALAATLGNETDKLPLLDFKSHVAADTLGALSSWNDSLHFCQWIGVSCGRKHQRVTGLNLEGQKLAGSLSPHIGNLSFLQSLNLSRNSFHGSIPPEIGRLFRLQNLNLSYNSFGGEIPANLSNCSNLMNLYLGDNSLVHQIPSELGSLSKLLVLSLETNNLTGSFPASLGNLSSLRQLLFTYNHLEGEIPDTIALITGIKDFKVGVNNLSGLFPPSLYNLPSLEFISLADNRFSGNLRPDLGIALPNLKSLHLGGNDFTGTIPASLSNASNILDIDIPGNNFTGNVPASFGSLQNLNWFNSNHNSLGSNATDDLSFLLPLTNCSKLQWLDFSYNNFGGELPVSLTNLSIQLTRLDLAGNKIGGSIPTGIANLNNLQYLGFDDNLLTGIIPASIGRLSNLNVLSLGANKLKGGIPSSFGNITQLLNLYLYNNSLEGNIPSSLGNCKNLQDLLLCHNKFNGTIPMKLTGASSLLIHLNVSHNSLSGPLPQEVGNLITIVYLDVSHNRFSGEIPSTLKNCLDLEQLYMEGNHLEGTIPDLSGLKGIQFLDLSHNNLSGQIPKYMVSFPSLQNLNLSVNNLEGEVPVLGVFQNASAIEVYGNSKLCGGIQGLQLPPCPLQSKNQRKHRAFLLILVIVIVALSALMSSFIYWLRKLKKKELSTSSFGHFYLKVSYEELRNATAAFSFSNLIGSGHFGSVYKGILGPGENTVAVKVLKLQQHGASKSFMAECEALRNIRHRNLVKVLTACSSTDFQGNEFKALVYDFMPNGSLETWLHPEEGRMHLRNLNFLQRLNISIDVASALLYLHQHCHSPVVHCDLKPSNILLDDDLTAHVGDFGMARLLSKSGKEALLNQFSSAGIKGTIGYAAPEYGMGSQLSTNGDVYSFGILLLEMFTGKRPTDELFIDDLNLHNFVKLALPVRVMEAVDQSILYDEEVGEIKNTVNCCNKKNERIECLISIFQIAILCSAESPQDRMDMRGAVLELLSIRDRFLGTGIYAEKMQGPVNRTAIQRCILHKFVLSTLC